MRSSYFVNYPTLVLNACCLCFINDCFDMEFWKNATGFNATQIKFRRAIWINDVVFRCILAVVSLYLLIALFYHQMKFKRPRKTERFFHLSVRRRYERLSRFVCYLIAFASVLRHAAEIVCGVLETNKTILYDKTGETFCDIVHPLAHIALTIGIDLFYLFLWLKQRVFYVDSSMKVINNNCLEVLSFCIRIVMSLYWCSLFIVYFIKIS